MKPEPIAPRKPLTQRGVNDQTIRERAEFLAREIQGDVFAREKELADAIEVEVRRYARPIFLSGKTPAEVKPGGGARG